MKWRWLLVIAVVVIGSCGTALSIAAHNDASAAFVRSRDELRESLTKHAPRFRDDLKALSAWPQLAKRNGKDCGALLTAKVPYPDAADRFHYKHVIPENIAAALDACVPTKFPDKVMSLDVSGVDTSWMSQLASCDQWDLSTDPVVAQQRPLHLDTMPLPSATEARRWALVRLLQGLHDGRVKEAGADVENLGRLLVTSEVATVENGAFTIFQYERAAYEAAKAKGLDVDGWAPLDAAALAALSRALPAWRAITDVHASIDMVGADLFTSPDFAVGRCAAIQEGARVLMQIEPVTTELYGDAHALLQAALQGTAGSCRLTRTREAWEHAGQNSILVSYDALCDPDDGSCVPVSIAGHLPGLREAMVEELGTIDPRSAFAGYEHARR